jgi:hypothetical protein
MPFIFPIVLEIRQKIEGTIDNFRFVMIPNASTHPSVKAVFREIGFHWLVTTGNGKGHPRTG